MVKGMFFGDHDPSLAPLAFDVWGLGDVRVRLSQGLALRDPFGGGRGPGKGSAALRGEGRKT